VARTAVERLRLAVAPWAVTWPAPREAAYELAWQLQAKDGVARVVRGWKAGTLDGLFDEVAAALQFPAYFGENWPALDECLKDMAWLRGAAYTVIVADAHLLFGADRTDSLATLLDLAESAGQAWAQPADLDRPWGHDVVPFHFVLQVPEAELDKWRARLARSGHKAPTVAFAFS
jgi:hypothetical protein